MNVYTSICVLERCKNVQTHIVHVFDCYHYFITYDLYLRTLVCNHLWPKRVVQSF